MGWVFSTPYLGDYARFIAGGYCRDGRAEKNINRLPTLTLDEYDRGSVTTNDNDNEQ